MKGSFMATLSLLFIILCCAGADGFNGDTLIGIYQPNNVFTSLRAISTSDGAVVVDSDVPIPSQPNDYYNAGGTYDDYTGTYSYRYVLSLSITL